MSPIKSWERFSGVITALLVAGIIATLLFLLRSFVTGNADFWYMDWNLVLSYFALLSAVGFWFFRQTSRPRLAWLFLGIWFLMLPNTFYMLTDFVHVNQSGDINILYDIVLVGFFAMNGFVHGIMSTYIVHKTLLHSHKKNNVHAFIIFCLLCSSFAIDLGRYMRWNSWDVVFNTRAVLFDVSNTFLNPVNYDRSFLITGIFFVTTASLYFLWWEFSKSLNPKRK